MRCVSSWHVVLPPQALPHLACFKASLFLHSATAPSVLRMQAWQMSSAARRRGLGLLLPLGFSADGSPAAQREAPPAEEVLITNASSSGAVIPRETSDMVVRYIFAQARSAGSSSAHFCVEAEQMVRAISADQKVQRTIVEAWEKERREETFKALLLQQGGGLNGVGGNTRQGGVAGASRALLMNGRQYYQHQHSEGESKRPEEEVPRPSYDPVSTNDSSTSANGNSSPNDVREAIMAIRCAICLGVFQDATMINCSGNHVFCRECIGKLPTQSSWSSLVSWARTLFGMRSDETRTCPQCRAPFTDGFPVRVMDDLIARLRPVFAKELDDDECCPMDTDGDNGDPFVKGGAVGGEGTAGIFYGVVTLVVIIAFILTKRGW